jgi:peroxiredoxin Q/BCP
MNHIMEEAMKLVFATALLGLALGLSSARADVPFKVGDRVPEFKLPYATQDTVVFSGYGSENLKGQRYMIAFYPADWSPGCTKEMCTFRDSFSDLEKLGVKVVPISADLVFSDRAWAQYQKFPFKLLADQTREFGKKMGVYDPKTGMFHRSIFVVGPDGRFEYINYNYSVQNDTDYNQLKAFLASKK